MSLTSVLFNYNVAKIIDTPWNTIINGLNYTKTNLSPLGLRYTLANNYDNGMLLKEVAGNSINQYVPVEDFSWNNAELDYTDPYKYWIVNTSHKTCTASGPAIYLASRYLNENGLEYTEITQPISMTKLAGCGQIIYQDNTNLYVYYSNIRYSSGYTTYIYRYIKDGNVLKTSNSYSCSDGIISVLDIKDGFIYCLYTYGSSTAYRYIKKIEISTGIETTITSTDDTGPDVLTSYPSNVVNEHFYVKHMATNIWYRYTFNNLRKSVNRTVLNCPEDNSVFTSSSYSYCGHIKRFNHIFNYDGNEFLVAVTLNSYSYETNSNVKSTIQVYAVEGDSLTLKQCLIVDGLSLIPKNDWKTLFIGTSSGIKVFQWDEVDLEYEEQPTIFTTCQQFGFDIDERLWIMDGNGGIYRYTYNQPITVDYKFEDDVYEIGTEVVETYVDVKVLNYMGENLTTKIKLKAIGNFTFINNSKEIEVTLTSNDYIRLPVYLTGSGKYEIRI